MHTKHLIVMASAVALALTAVLAACAHTSAAVRNGLIVFTARVEGTNQIVTINPDGSGQKQLTHVITYGAGMPSISPDGRTIVFFQWIGSTREIRAMSITGTDSRHLATTALVESLCYSPDGRRVAFVIGGQVCLMNANGSHRRRLTALAGGTKAWFASYSPDGKTIAFAATDAANKMGPCEILAMNADGTHLRRLAYTTVPGSMLRPTWEFSFSPDGKKIIYYVYTNRAESATLIRVMNADGSDQRPLPGSSDCLSPCYSPDGREIVCVNGNLQIAVANADGTHWRQLTHILGGTFGPRWGPQAR